MSRQVLDRILRLRIVGVITKEVHGRDIIERLIKSQTMDLQTFEWQMQLRFYWERSEQNEDCFIRQTITRFKYNYVPILPPVPSSTSVCFSYIGVSGLYQSIGDLAIDRSLLHYSDYSFASVSRWKFQRTCW